MYGLTPSQMGILLGEDSPLFEEENEVTEVWVCVYMQQFYLFQHFTLSQFFTFGFLIQKELFDNCSLQLVYFSVLVLTLSLCSLAKPHNLL